MSVLVLSHDDVLAALPPAECADAMATVLAEQARGGTHMPLRSVMIPPEAAGFMGLMPGWRASHDGLDASFAVKVVCIMPGNPARGMDAHQGLVALFDGQTGVPTAILDGSAVTQVRTAAVTAVATGALARPDASTLAVIGAGVQAHAHLQALRHVRKFEQVRVFAPTTEHARALADYFGNEGWMVTVAASAHDAVRDADVVVTATSSREPVLRREWLAPGTHLNAIGASTPRAREIDAETLAASAVFCDSRESVRNEAGEYLQAVSEGLIDGIGHVRAELGEVLAGLAEGRRDERELTLFRSLGLAVEDLAAAERAVAIATARGIGVQVQL
jgi:ornithine cyclodeaminase/alanine dehydrogenase-like protein (mu-crystallin family)